MYKKLHTVPLVRTSAVHSLALLSLQSFLHPSCSSTVSRARASTSPLQDAPNANPPASAETRAGGERLAALTARYEVENPYTKANYEKWKDEKKLAEKKAEGTDREEVVTQSPQQRENLARGDEPFWYCANRGDNSGGGEDSCPAGGGFFKVRAALKQREEENEEMRKAEEEVRELVKAERKCEKTHTFELDETVRLAGTHFRGGLPGIISEEPRDGKYTVTLFRDGSEVKNVSGADIEKKAAGPPPGVAMCSRFRSAHDTTVAVTIGTEDESRAFTAKTNHAGAATVTDVGGPLVGKLRVDDRIVSIVYSAAEVGLPPWCPQATLDRVLSRAADQVRSGGRPVPYLLRVERTGPKFLPGVGRNILQNGIHLEGDCACDL